LLFFFLIESIFPLQNNIILRESSFYQLGQSPKILRPKPHGLERTDSQTIGDFATRRKGMYFSTACCVGHWEFIYFVMFFHKKQKKKKKLNLNDVNTVSQHVNFSSDRFPWDT
jgi:hypothetical protein